LATACSKNSSAASVVAELQVDLAHVDLALDVERREAVEFLQVGKLLFPVPFVLVQVGQLLERLQVQRCALVRLGIGAFGGLDLALALVRVAADHERRRAAGLELQDFVRQGDGLVEHALGEVALGRVDELADLALGLDGEGDFFDERVHGHGFGDEVAPPRSRAAG
jgi:hypothetical protein